MFKTQTLRLFFLIGALSAAQIPVQLSSNCGIEWVCKYVDEYPEILWLADVKVRKTEEAQAGLQGAYSERLFGCKFVEFDRTIMTLKCLQLILDGSDQAYFKFTKDQPTELRLSRKSFEKLHEQGVSLATSKEMIQAMEAALVLGDIGKSEIAREIFRPYGANSPDHDDFHGEVLPILQKHPSLCPTFNRLSAPSKKLLSQTANLAHYGHITHLEGGPAMFTPLRASGIAVSSPDALSFDLFIHACDVAGALGHVNNQSSLRYTEETHLAVQATNDACKTLCDPQKTAKDAYEAYLAIRAGWLGLNASDRIDRALTRVGAMLRLFTPEEGNLLQQAFLSLDAKTQAQIIQQLDIEDGTELSRTPTYMPALLVNLADNMQLGSCKEERLAQAVTLGLPFLSRVLAKQKELLADGQRDPQIPLNFNKAAGVAKIAPLRLSQEFTIDLEGNVIPKEPKGEA